MQTENLNTNKKRVDKEKIQKKVMYATLVIFFIATVSAAGGFLQGERVASSSVNNLAAVNLSIAGTNYSFKDNKVLNGINVVGEYSCPSSECSGFVNVSGFWGMQKRVDLKASCTGSSCTFSALGKNWPLNESQITQLRKLTGVPSKSQQPETKTNSNSNSNETNSNDSTNKDQANTDRCDSLKTADGKCRNKCSTTYIKGWPAQIKDCGRAFGNPIYKAINKLNSCIQQVTKKDQQQQLDKAICYVSDPASVIKEGKSSDSVTEVAKTASEQGKLYVPARCLSLLQKVESLKKAGIEQGKNVGLVSEKEASKCSYNGLSVCLFDTQINKYKCTAKGGTGTSINTINNNNSNPTTSDTQNQCSGSFTEKFKCVMQNLLQGGNGGSNPNTQGLQPQSNQPYSGGGGGNQCPQGYSQSSSGGQCIQDGSGVDIPKPQCLIVASKEKIKAGESVIIRWRTANAESVNIYGIGSNLSKNNQKSLTPTNSITYKLFAYGRGNDNTKTCEVRVGVNSDTGGGYSGDLAPRISCGSSTILKGKESTVSWECPTDTYSSSGDGVDTKGKKSGSVSISPKYNTKYSISCLDKNKKEVGKNSCFVSVGNPQYEIIAYPSSAKQGDRVRISWGSLFMNTCRVKGPRGFDYSKKQGVVITEPFSLKQENAGIKAAVYTLECESSFGESVSKDVMVKFKK